VISWLGRDFKSIEEGFVLLIVVVGGMIGLNNLKFKVKSAKLRKLAV